MASMESKSVKIHPDLEQEIIAKHELFGWRLVSSQEIMSQTSYQ